MTTPTNSGRLREIQERYKNDENLKTFPGAGDIPFLLSTIEDLIESNNEGMRIANLMRHRATDAEAEIHKLNAENEALIDALNSGHMANARLNAEKAETIEVLERAGRLPHFQKEFWDYWHKEAKPLLNKLKGSPDQTKEGS